MLGQKYTQDQIVVHSLPTHWRFEDLTGWQFERLLVLGYAGRVGRRTHWWCKCDCGAVIKPNAENLKNGHTQSCGCLNNDNHTERLTKHGLYGTVEYHTYYSMKKRCEDVNSPKWPRYGGRGVKFLYTSVEQFIADVGTRPEGFTSIDRKDNDGNYESGNCRWATAKQQARNTSSNVYLNVGGKQVLQQDVLTKYGKHVHNRITRLGWCVDCAIKVPKNRGTCPHRKEKE